jgi:hypothetical protein
MAFFLFYGSGSSLSSRLNVLALIALVLVCFCSYCSSSSSLISPIIDGGSSLDDIDTYDIEDEITYYTPLKLSSFYYRNVPEQAILPIKNRFHNLLFKSALIQPDYRNKIHNRKRYVPQSFHAMRG